LCTFIKENRGSVRSGENEKQAGLSDGSAKGGGKNLRGEIGTGGS